MEYVLQKGTEAGVFSFVPVIMERSISKILPKDEAKKQERWQKIALEAAKQALRTHYPKVSLPLSFSSLLAQVQSHDLFLVPWEKATECTVNTIYKVHPQGKSIGILIGPEGGISQKEVSLLQQVGALPITLGKRIFRTETAGLAAAIALFALYGDMG